MMFHRLRVLITLLLVPGLLLVAALPGRAIDIVQLELGTLEGEGWSAEAVTLQLNWLDKGHAGLVLQIARMDLPQGLGELSGVVLTCLRAEYSTTRVKCARGTLKTRSGILGRQSVQTSFSYQFDSGRIETGLQGVHLYDGTLAIRASLQDGRWQLTVQGDGLSLPGVIRQLTAAGVTVPELEGSARLNVSARLNGDASGFRKASIETRLQARELSDAAGSLAAENLDLSLHAVVESMPRGLQVSLDMNSRQGALYIDPVFVEMPAQALQLSARFDWLTAKQQLILKSLNYHHPGSVRLAATGQLDFSAEQPLEELQLDLQEAIFPAFYDTYLQPWLIDTTVADLDTAGRLSGKLGLKQGKPSRVTLVPDEVSVDDREGRFSLQKITGQLQWHDRSEPLRSKLAWEGGSVFEVALGATQLAFDAGRDEVRLVDKVRLPVLDGVLEIDDFQLAAAAETPLSWRVNGLLEPVSLSQLSVALGWPELAGKLSGVIPNVRYDAGNLAVGGILLIRVFEGEVTLRNVTLEQPFGLVPRLQLDARIDGIDLETLTRTFSFGRIEGRLDGRIEGLRMESWRPVAFDAWFATPENDKSRHRISQKAVDNISSIGGGVGGALSRSFMRFFEDFPYDRLGIRCKLENGVCDMGGVAPAKEGYYLVKGRLIPPRLDVIGYADRVNWDTLVAQIMAVTSQQEVIVE